MRSGAQLLSCAVFIRCLTCSFTRGRLAKDTWINCVHVHTYISPSAKAASLRKRQSTAHSSSADAVSRQVQLVQTAEEQSSRLAATSAGAVFRLTWRPTCCCDAHRGRGVSGSDWESGAATTSRRRRRAAGLRATAAGGPSCRVSGPQRWKRSEKLGRRGWERICGKTLLCAWATCARLVRILIV